MAINTSSKEMPAGDGSPTAGSTINKSDFPTAPVQNKVFSSLQDDFALKGHDLQRTNPAKGQVTYWAERWGLVQHLPTIDAVRRFLEQIGGRL
ncbi:MAG: hypothetical protein CVU36_01465 [Betaproteobacteria bacterium HGW-Betaproteobacteria-9]|jgi:hypothetical protein|nr:MAG: hypothetical protein CVU36_01465 [Betaproteobacteria bacterium HGW-Betaproteobacteria-9]